MVAPIFGNVGVKIPKVVLAFHTFDSRAFLVPHLGDVEKHIRLPAHLFGLVRLKQVKLWCAENLFTRIVPPGLRDHPHLKRQFARIHMVSVVGVVFRMA